MTSYVKQVQIQKQQIVASHIFLARKDGIFSETKYVDKNCKNSDVQSNSVITITVITNTRLLRTN